MKRQIALTAEEVVGIILKSSTTSGEILTHVRKYAAERFRADKPNRVEWSGRSILISFEEENLEPSQPA